jgi:hypothetical protein
MPIFETFARRRQKEALNGEPEVYTYDEAPEQLRHQIALALVEGLGRYHVFTGNELSIPPNANEVWTEIDRICRKEILSYLKSARGENLANRFLNHLHTAAMDDFLSMVEIGCRGLGCVTDEYDETRRRGAEQAGIGAVEEINGRFEQHAVGYQFENGHIIRVDSKLAHAEIIKPALSLLTARIFHKANADFMTAHRHYRVGEFKDCVTSAHRAFESMLKAICDTEGWKYGKGDGASELITRVSSAGLFTHDFDKSFTAYIAMLKTGLPSVRNDAGGHGEGLATGAVTAQIARFALNLTASNILFLGESYDAISKRA